MRHGGRADGGNRLDQVRLLFASLVLVSHASEYATGTRTQEPLTQLFHTISCGELAVDGFFILSGFLITQSWHRQPDAGAFLRKRVLRLYPAFVVACLLSVFVVGRLGATDPTRYYASLDPVGLAWALVSLMPPPTPDVFGGLPYPYVNGAMWTISYEFGCYLGLMLAGLLGLLSRPRAVVALWIAAIVLYLGQHVAREGTGGGAVFYDAAGALVRFAMLFSSGMAFATVRFHGDRRPVVVCGAMGVLLAGLAVPVLAEPALATAGAYLLLVAGLTPRSAGERGWPDISYGTYLYGAPVQMLLLFFLPGLPWLVVFMASLFIALTLGALSWRWIEAPVLLWAANRDQAGAGRAPIIAASSVRIASVSALADGIARR